MKNVPIKKKYENNLTSLALKKKTERMTERKKVEKRETFSPSLFKLAPL